MENQGKKNRCRLEGCVAAYKLKGLLLALRIRIKSREESSKLMKEN